VSDVNCDKFEKSISLYLDGRLDEDEVKALEEHLARCPRCSRTLATLEAAEKSAKTSRTREPRAEYWDTFSARVGERIDSREAARGRSILERLSAVFFSAPPRKLRIAAGVASIAVAFAVGILYVEHRGEGIFPKVGRAPVVDEGKREEVADREQPVTEPQEGATDKMAEAGDRGAATTEAQEYAAKTKVVPKGESDAARDASKDQSDAMKGDEAQKLGQSPAAKPSAQLKEEARAPETQEATEAPKATEPPVKEPTPEVAQARETHKLGTAPREAQKTLTTREVPPEKEDNEMLETLTLSDTRAVSTSSAELLAAPAPPARRISDSDTLLTDDELRRHIDAWKTYIDKNPPVRIGDDAYVQVATGYALLAGRTKDEDVITKGADLVRSYIDRARDPKVKEALTARLRQIEDLENK
jgi:hypothetical protein